MEERINLSQREREQLRVLHEIEQGHLSQVGASRIQPNPRIRWTLTYSSCPGGAEPPAGFTGAPMSERPRPVIQERRSTPVCDLCHRRP